MGKKGDNLGERGLGAGWKDGSFGENASGLASAETSIGGKGVEIIEDGWCFYVAFVFGQFQLSWCVHFGLSQHFDLRFVLRIAALSLLWEPPGLE